MAKINGGRTVFTAEEEYIHQLESSNAAPKAEIEKYKKALDEIIALNHPHGEDSQHCALCIAR